MCFSAARIARVLCALSVVACAACGHGARRFEATCQIVRRDTVEQDQNGVAQLVDLELEWDPCPGDQFQVIRGGREFAACMKRYEVGMLVPVLVKQWWDERGYYTWDVYQVGQCARTIEPNAEGSYEKSQDCRSRRGTGR